MCRRKKKGLRVNDRLGWMIHKQLTSNCLFVMNDVSRDYPTGSQTNQTHAKLKRETSYDEGEKRKVSTTSDYL